LQFQLDLSPLVYLPAALIGRLAIRNAAQGQEVGKMMSAS